MGKGMEGGCVCVCVCVWVEALALGVLSACVLGRI